jgi:hypothetical protein
MKEQAIDRVFDVLELKTGSQPHLHNLSRQTGERRCRAYGVRKRSRVLTGGQKVA